MLTVVIVQVAMNSSVPQLDQIHLKWHHIYHVKHKVLWTNPFKPMTMILHPYLTMQQ